MIETKFMNVLKKDKSIENQFNSSKLSTNKEEIKEKFKLTENKINNSIEIISQFKNQVIQDNIHINSKN